ncbi:MAG: divergent PAP2 family protein [Clostridia bacterium]|nr:divergent PAP2 family protein [Clostridia bacterium]
MDSIKDLFANPFLMTGLSSWFIAQILKTVIHCLIHKKLDLHRLIGDGGMPSGHSATVTSLAIFSALTYGTGSFEFAVTTILATIVCHDAMGVRLETGKQAVVLNEMLSIFNVLTTEQLPEVKLKEFVGHTPIQVLAGILVGVVNAVVMYHFVF